MLNTKRHVTKKYKLKNIFYKKKKEDVGEGKKTTTKKEPSHPTPVSSNIETTQKHTHLNLDLKN
jgi:hypothetical protein